MIRLLALTLVALLVAGAAAQQRPSPTDPRGDFRDGSVPIDDPQALLDDAATFFERGVQTFERDPAAARAAFEQAAVRYHALVERHGIDNHRLLINLGNAAMLAGDDGRAVLAYRRAAELRPTSDLARRSLEQARRRVGIKASPTARERLAMLLLSWCGLVPRPWLFAFAMGVYVALWALALARLGGLRWTRRPALALGAFFAVAIGLLVVDHASRVNTEHAVVVQAGGADAYNGPDAGVYEETFGRPIPAGAEVRVLERRAGWARVRLLGGLETWVEVDTIEPV